MLVDLSLKNSDVLILGGGRIGTRKAKNVLSECKTLTIASDRFSREAKNLTSVGAVLVKVNLTDMKMLSKLLSKADLVIAATSGHQLNQQIAQKARALKVLVGSVDDPSNSDFHFPAVRTVGGIRVGVTTGGRSPAMAKLICGKLAREIPIEDRLRVQLLGELRKFAKDKLRSPALRKAGVYKVLQDKQIEGLLRQRHYEEAKTLAKGIIAGR